nr:carboxypeptidase-like regulatory domain-containing protein [Niabella beijingensis]
MVTLFPVTPYFLDFLELKKKKQNLQKLRYVYLSNEAYQFRLTAITNSNGEFTFPNMKPGRYYLETTVGQVVSGTVDVYAGHANTNYGNVNYYQQKNYSNDYYDLATKFVEIQKDGEVVEIKLK